MILLTTEKKNSLDCYNLKFKYVGPTKDVIFNEQMDSKELFNAIKKYSD